MEQKVIGFGQNTFLVKISKFPITAGVTCLRLRNFLKNFSKKKKFFFAQMEQKVIGFGQNTFLVKISKFPITAGVMCLRLRNYLNNIFRQHLKIMCNCVTGLRLWNFLFT